MNASPLYPGDSKLGYHLREARVKIWSGMLGVLVAFRYCGKHQGQKQLEEDQAYTPQPVRWEFKARVWRQKLKQTAEENPLRVFPLVRSVCFLM